MNTPVDPVTCGIVRAALVELLTTGQHHHAGTHPTLTAVGDTRRALATQHGTPTPAAHFDDNNQRLAALDQALEAVGSALIAVPSPRDPDATGLRDGLAELAAVTLGWLDLLSDPQPDDQLI